MGRPVRKLTKPICYTAMLFLLCAITLAGCIKAKPEQSEMVIKTPYPVLATPAPGMLYIVKDGARLRSAPNASSAIIRTLKCSDTVLWLHDEGNWCKVKLQNVTGYIARELVSETEIFPQLPDALVNPRIVVYKSERTLLLCDADRVYDRYHIGLGWQPVGYKECEGDGKTPEGSYYVCTKNPNSRYYLSLGVSYPNIEDAKRGLAAGSIDQLTYTSIQRAIVNRLCPPWNTALGGEIMIHGSGSQSDWTAGCIAVDNKVMDILYRMCPIGTRIEIYP